MSQQYQFEGTKYSTPGVASLIPIQSQLFMWEKITELRDNTELDYLQVFSFTPETSQDGTLNQKVIHSQEYPPYLREHIFPTSTPVRAKVFIIDDITHCRPCSHTSTNFWYKR